MNNYQKGRQKEYYVKDSLEELGYICMRSSGSHSVFDIIGMNDNEVRCIQVKYNCRPTRQEVEAIENMQLPEPCSKELWVFTKGTSKPEIYITKEGKLCKT